MRAKIFNASAGSGKTYQLAYKYVRDAIEQPSVYRHILAVTFTNKATEEMKSRILKEIHTLASGCESNYMQNLCRELHLSEEIIRDRARQVRSKILHDYSHFTVLTIDTFFQRILRAFIKELGLDLNYNIELETTTLLAKSTDALIEQIASDEDLKKWLIKFIGERIERGEKWDVREGILAMGNEIFKEANQEAIGVKGMRDKLDGIVRKATGQSNRTRQEIISCAQEAIDLMTRNGITPADFKGKSRSFAFYFQKIASGDLTAYTPTVAQMSTTTDGWCPKGSPAAPLVTTLQPLLRRICTLYDENFDKWNTTALLRENFRSFALLTDLYEQIKQMCEEQNLMLLSETKQILAEFIGDNDVPFIYEKVGNRFDRFMIDEFQDTSLREWKNFLPLLQNAMAQSEDNSVFLVGDIKQSIYRWRGGDWELLHHEAKNALGRNDTEEKIMRDNYRSLPAVVEFNNNLMARIIAGDNAALNAELNAAREQGILSIEENAAWHDMLKNAYAGHAQNAKRKCTRPGYVTVETYAEEPPVVECICQLLDRGFRPCDILILVRKKSDGAEIADKLLGFKQQNKDPRHHFDVMTQEALIIGSAPVSGFIAASMSLTINPDDKLNRAVYNRFLNRPFDQALDDDERQFFISLSILSPEEAFERIVIRHSLEEDRQQTAYLQAIHEQIIAFSANKVADIPLYLKWWEEQGSSKSLSIEESRETIEISTIHKAKGLEKPAVIIPYCQWTMDPRTNSIVWAKGTGNASEIGRFPVKYKKQMMESDFAKSFYHEKLFSHIDNINLLYVALTRAAESLHIFVPRKDSNRVSNLILNHINDPMTFEDVAAPDADRMTPIRPSWDELRQTTTDEGNIRYELGEPSAPEPFKESKDDSTRHVILEHYRTSEAELRLSLPSERYIEEMDNIRSPRDFGIMMHKAFQEAETTDDIREAIRQMTLDGLLNRQEADTLLSKLEEVMCTPMVADWFSGTWSDIRTENDIILPQGSTRRPDRVMIRRGEAVVVDYKFGNQPTEANRRQVRDYLSILRRMGYTPCTGYLWYVLRGEIQKVE